MDEMDDYPEEEAPPRHVVSSSGDTDLHYDLWCFTTPLGVTIQCIAVSSVEDRFLAAFPHQVWHRQVAKRVLPHTLLAKPLQIEVACSPEEAREEVDDAASMKLWVGYISGEVYDGMQVVGLDAAVDYKFKTADSGGFLPYAESLMEVLQEHYAFLSAESGEPSAPAAVGSPDLSSRVSHLEQTMGKMAENIDIVLQKVTETKEKDVRVKFAEPVAKSVPRPKRDARTEKFPGMDPAVVSAALAAGVTEENLQEMQRMMSSTGAASSKLREPALRTSPHAKKVTVQPLSESDEGEPEEGELGLPEATGGSPMENALVKLTELVGLLAADRVKKASASKVELALDGLVTGSGGESSTTSIGKRAAAARRALRTALVDAPEEIYGVVERLLLEDLTNQTVAHGMPKAELNARAWIEHRSKIGAYKTSAHCAWSAGGILDDLIRGRVAHARAKAALLVLQLDQCAVDKGDWTLASELSLEQGPPLSTLATHSPPRVNEGESPFSKLLDSRWSEVMLAHLREAEDYVQKRRNLGKKLAGEENYSESAKPKAKAKAKGKPNSQNEQSTAA
eukprot:s3148_g7.t1